MLLNKSPFVVVRFAAGSGGRFISSLFQLSESVSHWDSTIENNPFSLDKYVEYIAESFPYSPEKHLKVEPDLPYYSDFYSGTYPRGEDVTYEQFCKYQQDHDCQYFFDNLNNHRYVNLILHKSKVPCFMQGSKIINIIIDNNDALKLTQQLLWLKHYQVIDSTSVKRLPHDPLTCNQKRSHLVKQFFVGSAIVKVNTIESFYQAEVLDSAEIKLFQNAHALLSDSSNATCEQGNFYLSNIFSKQKLIDNINSICDQFNFAQVNQQLISVTYDMWWQRQTEMLKKDQ